MNLNNYKKRFHDESNGNCSYCNCKESISHLLFDCNINDKLKDKIMILRNNFYKDLKKITAYFKNAINRTAVNILFPHHWQQDPNIDNVRYKIIFKHNLEIRIKILKLASKFIDNTQRFKDEAWCF